MNADSERPSEAAWDGRPESPERDGWHELLVRTVIRSLWGHFHKGERLTAEMMDRIRSMPPAPWNQQAEAIVQDLAALLTPSALAAERASRADEVAALDRRLEREERGHEKTVAERDLWESQFGEVYARIVGEYPPWSNLFGPMQAIEQIEAAIDGRVEGAAEAMREAAAMCAQDLRHPDRSSETNDWVHGTIASAEAIRALPTPTTPALAERDARATIKRLYKALRSIATGHHADTLQGTVLAMRKKARIAIGDESDLAAGKGEAGDG